MSQEQFEILHCGRVGIIGGIEHLLTPFICYDDFPLPVKHQLMLRSNRVHPHIRKTIYKAADSVNFSKSWHGIRVPKHPPALRSMYHHYMVRGMNIDIVLVWNSSRDSYAWSMIHSRKEDKNSIFGQPPLVYYEHGQGWSSRNREKRRKFLASMDSAICCSKAAMRILQLDWEFKAPIDVCLNGLRPDMPLEHVKTKNIPVDRTIRLGVAARMVPQKGLNLAIHALSQLVQRGYDCELHIAGTGAEEDRLRAETKRLALESRIKFHGLVRDMAAFYREIDLFICPSINEPFGLVCLEAQAHACPVIAGNADGIPEVVIDKQTGFCITPDQPLKDYPGLGGGPLERLPPRIYDPLGDNLITPLFLDPAKIADAVIYMIDKPDAYARFSQNAHINATTSFNFNKYAQELLSTLKAHSVMRSASLQPSSHDAL